MSREMSLEITKDVAPLVVRDGPAPFAITDVLDIPALTDLFTSLTAMNDIVTALLDLEGRVLIATGWRDSCTLFHRKHDTTAARCLESDTALASALAEGSTYNVYNCRNGLVDVAVPVRVDGYHVGNLFTGQFFSEPPDLESFRAKARLYGFDETKYVAAIAAVPVFSRAEVERTMAFLTLLAENLGRMGLANLRLAETNAELERHRRQLEEIVAERTAQLSAAIDVARAANEAKSRFLANMSHEIRTPMNAILGFSSILARSDEASATQRHTLRIIERSGEHLLTLIDDVLEISRIDAGRSDLRDDHFDPGEVVEDVAAMFAAPCAVAGLRLEVDVDTSARGIVRGDGGKLRQVFINLVGNAIKFAREGLVRVQLRGERSPAGVRLFGSVEGDGHGIAPAEQELIFEPFKQSASGVAKREGTGLGLAITRSFVQLMDGSIAVQSDVDQGAIFTFDVQMKAVDTAALRRTGGDEADWVFADPPLSVLIADDVETNRMLLRAMLSPMDVDLREACDGIEAVAIATSWSPDIVVMDARMPGLDGLEATAQLADNPTTATIPVVIISASVLPSEQQTMIDAGALEVLPKPIQLSRLVRALGRHTRASSGRRPGPERRSVTAKA